MNDDSNDETLRSDPQGLDTLLTYLLESRGFDFDGYKRSGLERRLLKRASTIGLDGLAAYVDYLEVHPEEFGNLFNAVLINATSFFRDPAAWESLSTQTLPQILESRKNAPTIRVWSAGCATGQEPYSIAMILAEAMGIDAYARRVKIYATDLDEEALAQARQAVYSVSDVANVPAELAAKYLEPAGGKFVIAKDLRRCVIFGRHDLLNDAPISRVDLLLCRNTLMYFNAEAQVRILSNLHFALSPWGALLLGKAEMLLSHNSMFTPIDLKRRLFSKVSEVVPRRLAPLPVGARSEDGGQNADELGLRNAIFETSPVAQIGFDVRSTLRIFNSEARRTLGLSETDIGRALHELDVSRRVEGLVTSAEHALLGQRPIELVGVEWARVPDEPTYFDVSLVPLISSDLGQLHGLQISLVDVTAARRAQQELQKATRELENAYEELQATSEELETTNEELQSTVEELETTNEELQSTNEELETTNEELQSTNEELQGMNDELRARSVELGRVNLHFQAILANLRAGVIVLDEELRVQVWSERSYELWGLRANEVVGKHFLTLDIGISVDKLSAAIRACLLGERAYQTLTLPAVNRRGKSFQCPVTVTRLTQEQTASGVIVLMEEGELAARSPGIHAHVADRSGDGDGRTEGDGRAALAPTGDGRSDG